MISLLIFVCGIATGWVLTAGWKEWWLSYYQEWVRQLEEQIAGGDEQ